MKEDELLIARIEDKIEQASDRYMITAGDFLDTHQRKVCEEYFRSRKLPVRPLFYGGYEDAERSIPVFLPDYVELPDDIQGGTMPADTHGTMSDVIQGGTLPAETRNRMPEEISELLCIARVKAPRGSRALTHRDYLGSILALGLDREVTGDILVRQANDRDGGGADIIIRSEIADFIEMNYAKAGRTSLDVEILPIDMLDTGTVNIIEKQDTVASLRLDSIVSSAFALSRAKAAEAIRRGIVSVNSIEATKVDLDMHEGDKIVMRGRGKVILAQVDGRTRKDRVRIRFNIYK